MRFYCSVAILAQAALNHVEQQLRRTAMHPLRPGWAMFPWGDNGLVALGETGEMVMGRRNGWQEYPIKFPRPSNERSLYHRGLIISCDGRCLETGDKVYVLSIPQLLDKVLTIDYFHGWYRGLEGAAAVFEEDRRHDDRLHISRNMILVARRTGVQDTKGFVVHRIIHLQRRIRRWLAECRRQRALLIARQRLPLASAKKRPREGQ